MAWNYPDNSHSPVANYNFNNTLNDVSGNGLHLTVEAGSAAYSTAASPVSLVGFQFDGNNNLLYSSFVGALADLDNVTLELILRLDATSSLTGQLMTVLAHEVPNSDAGSATNSCYNFTYIQTNLNLRWLHEHSGGVNDIYTPGPPVVGSVGTTQHWIVTRTSNVIQFYLNGLASGAASGTLTAASDGSNGRLRVGGYNVGNNFRFRGLMCSATIYNSSLTATQVRERAIQVGSYAYILDAVSVPTEEAVGAATIELDAAIQFRSQAIGGSVRRPNPGISPTWGGRHARPRR